MKGRSLPWSSVWNTDIQLWLIQAHGLIWHAAACKNCLRDPKSKAAGFKMTPKVSSTYSLKNLRVLNTDRVTCRIAELGLHCFEFLLRSRIEISLIT